MYICTFNGRPRSHVWFKNSVLACRSDTCDIDRSFAMKRSSSPWGLLEAKQEHVSDDDDDDDDKTDVLYEHTKDAVDDESEDDPVFEELRVQTI